jgi:hypothetical protein
MPITQCPSLTSPWEAEAIEVSLFDVMSCTVIPVAVAVTAAAAAGCYHLWLHQR